MSFLQTAATLKMLFQKNQPFPFIDLASKELEKLETVQENLISPPVLELQGREGFLLLIQMPLISKLAVYYYKTKKRTPQIHLDIGVSPDSCGTPLRHNRW